MGNLISKQGVLAWIEGLQRAYAANRQRLTDLDSAIGDADHGSNLDRGFSAVQTELAAHVPEDIRGVLQTTATVLIKTVGGASGPLYGTFFLRAAASCAGKPELDETALVAMFRAGIEGVQQRGKAVIEDKTMLDTLLPGLSAMQASLDQGGSIADVLSAAAEAAEKGMLSTIPLEARKGRASYLGARSIGHQDPGATSAFLLIEAARNALP
jgi:dihydroxyacetone kinase-like protein